MTEETLDYRCNLCGTPNQRPVSNLGREAFSCSKCGLPGRLRALARLISDELFGAPIAFPDFPSIRSWTALGMSDVEGFAQPLASKFSYTNTYFHKPPLFDVTKPDPSLDGKYDFIISSEVLEHIPDPVEPAFHTLYRMLKPKGVLFLTVPYSLEDTTVEHFAELHDFAVTSLRDSWVLVNRTADGRLQTYDNLVFHGGPGSTLEMRVFNEAAIKTMLASAGFQGIRIAGEVCKEFGIFPDEPWSLPIAARKGERSLRSAAFTELATEYAGATKQLRATEADLERRSVDYEQYILWAKDKVAALETEMTSILDWSHAIEHESQLHITHIAQLKAENGEINKDFEQRTTWALALQQENESLTARCRAFENSSWVRLGRRLRRF